MENMEYTEFYDLHCHFLPGMDDGCKTPEESIRLLHEQYRQGCRGVVATSHYYSNESIHSFLKRRAQSASRLVQALQERIAEIHRTREEGKNSGALSAGVRIPHVVFGAEVAYRDSLVKNKELEKLCFGSSRYLLLEMPFTPWTDRTIRGVEEIENTWGITPIIAHIERYLDVADKDYIEALLDSDVLVQLNAGNFGSWRSARNAAKLIRNGSVQVLGTDSHNLEKRPPNMKLAIEGLRKKNMDEELGEILATNRNVFMAARGEA